MRTCLLLHVLCLVSAAQRQPLRPRGAQTLGCGRALWGRDGGARLAVGVGTEMQPFPVTVTQPVFYLLGSLLGAHSVT